MRSLDSCCLSCNLLNLEPESLGITQLARPGFAKCMLHVVFPRSVSFLSSTIHKVAELLPKHELICIRLGTCTDTCPTLELVLNHPQHLPTSTSAPDFRLSFSIQCVGSRSHLRLRCKPSIHCTTLGHASRGDPNWTADSHLRVDVCIHDWVLSHKLLIR